MIKRIIIFITSLMLVLPALFVYAAPGEEDAPQVTAVRGSAVIYQSGGYHSTAVYRGKSNQIIAYFSFITKANDLECS